MQFALTEKHRSFKLIWMEKQKQKDCWSKFWEYLGRPTAGHDHSEQPVSKAVIVVDRSSTWSGPGKLTTLQLYSVTQIDQNTGKGKLSLEANLKSPKKTKHGKIPTITYRATFKLEAGFGPPGAVVIKNGDRNEFFLRTITVEVAGNGSGGGGGGGGCRVHFDCRSWIYPVKHTSADRLFFSTTSYLPSQTPAALRELRAEELRGLRGTSRGERKKWERIYDYDCYNDLGDPSRGPEYDRPVLGGSQSYPYPRRLRTGRPLSDTDHRTETRHKLINLDFYVPPDERFSPAKLSEFISSSVQAVIHFVLPEVKSLFEGNSGHFDSFGQIAGDLYSGGNGSLVLERIIVEKLKEYLPEDLFKEVLKASKDAPSIKFPLPQVIAVDQFAWRTDEEFAREMLAGMNPLVIRRLLAFPPVGKVGRPSSISPSHIENNLDGLTIQQALDENRIFILDHHDYLMPYLRRINALGQCTYASRTLLLRRDGGTLKPLVIELSLPGEGLHTEINRVFRPAAHGTEAALWQLAKAHVSINDSGYHQLISHWLHTHAAVEPFIIATRRQLSVMHPVHRLLQPHFKDTLHINSLARSVLLNAGGILEKTMSPAKFAVELSSAVYHSWRFDDQALPSDLLNRGVAVEDPSRPAGVRLLLEDYPYAADGLDVWCAIQSWVSSFCSHFYPSDAAVAGDDELRAWWTEVRVIGHGDLPAGALRPQLNTIHSLSLSLTTLIWMASALHAAVNFGQYAYAGYPPNRPTSSRRFIPPEGSPEFADLVSDPDQFFMETIPDRFTATLGVALIEVLSRHAGEEVYLGRRAAGEDDVEWTDDAEVIRMFREFGEELRRVEKRIEQRNGNSRLKNRRGPAAVPYTLMFPDSGNDGSSAKGLTGKGIPNSVSI
ncbi:putative linoleate 9S-lipoxygenase 5 [Apostasia shenzhenica]|uniref:Lipoxygenase n=1 Tax=Apostasia shenzhenica TaxID=1088818 RepID=A0A2I0BFZ0_9ASPA|nr:putative linoleate 9S-lipoxygenase 5 [Apostasia shenzhenica]